MHDPSFITLAISFRENDLNAKTQQKSVNHKSRSRLKIEHWVALPHNLIKDKLVDLIERIFQREGSLYIACNDRHAFFTSDAVKYYSLWSCQKVCESLTFL